MPQSARRPSTNAVAAARNGRSLRALAAAILAGGTAAAVLFLPGVTVEAEGPVDPSNPYPISFAIANANFIPLTNVNAYLVICYAVAAPAPPAPVCQPPYGARLFKASWRDHSLSAKQHFSITLDDFMRFAEPAKIGGADLSIIVEYQPWGLPFRQEKEFGFAADLRTDGRWIGYRDRLCSSEYNWTLKWRAMAWLSGGDWLMGIEQTSWKRHF